MRVRNVDGYMQIMTSEGWEPMNGETMARAEQVDAGEYPLRKHDIAWLAADPPRCLLEDLIDRGVMPSQTRNVRTKLY